MKFTLAHELGHILLDYAYSEFEKSAINKSNPCPWGTTDYDYDNISEQIGLPVSAQQEHANPSQGIGWNSVNLMNSDPTFWTENLINITSEQGERILENKMCFFHDSPKVYVMTNDGLFRSENGGVDFEKLTSIGGSEFAVSSGDIIYIATGGPEGLQKSTTANGTNYTKVNISTVIGTNPTQTGTPVGSIVFENDPVVKGIQINESGNAVYVNLRDYGWISSVDNFNTLIFDHSLDGFYEMLAGRTHIVFSGSTISNAYFKVGNNFLYDKDVKNFTTTLKYTTGFCKTSFCEIVNNLFAKDGKIYVATNSGLFIFINNTFIKQVLVYANPNQFTLDVDDYNRPYKFYNDDIKDIYVTNNRIYAGTANGLYFSSDTGNSFFKLRGEKITDYNKINYIYVVTPDALKSSY